MDKVVHFEIPADNLDAARAFYSAAFGWALQDWPMQDGSTYIGVSTVPVDEATHLPKEPGAINGGLVKRSETAKTPIVAVKVDSIDAAVQKIISLGGKLVLPKWDVLGMGFYAYIADPEGNVVGLWEDAKKQG